MFSSKAGLLKRTPPKRGQVGEVTRVYAVLGMDGNILKQKRRHAPLDQSNGPLLAKLERKIGHVVYRHPLSVAREEARMIDDPLAGSGVLQPIREIVAIH